MNEETYYLMVKSGTLLSVLFFVMVFFIALPFFMFQFPDQSEITDFRNKVAFSDSVYFFAANFYNNEDLMPHWFREFVKLASIIGHNRIYLSVYENDSRDNSGVLLQAFCKKLDTLGIPHRIVTEKNYLRRHYPGRIDYLAVVRNKALAPLLEFVNNGTKFADSGYTSSLINSKHSRVVFINDIYFKAIDIVRLIGTHGHNYGVACGLDFYSQFYDHYVTRDIQGSWFVNVYPYVKEPRSQQLVRENKDFPVYSCWNGAASMSVQPFYKHNIKFRSSSANDTCDHSECFLICEDFRELNYTHIYINPSVKVAYKKSDYLFQQYLMSIVDTGLSMFYHPTTDYVAPEFSERPEKRLTVQCGIPPYA